MIDSDGFRANVGIILANTQGQVLWAKRIGHDSWQFPQGGSIMAKLHLMRCTANYMKKSDFIHSTWNCLRLPKIGYATAYQNVMSAPTKSLCVLGKNKMVFAPLR